MGIYDNLPSTKQGKSPEPEPAPNMPEPTRRADKIAMKAAELLDRDIWDTLTETRLVIRGVEFMREKPWKKFLHISINEGAVDDLKREHMGEPFRDVLNESFSAAMARKREKGLRHDEKNINNEKHAEEEAKRAADREAYKKKKERDQDRAAVIKFICFCLAVLIIVVGGVIGLSYLAEKDEAARAADLAQVNEYGFKKGDIPSTKRGWDYPGDCFKDGSGFQWTQSLSSCKRHLKAWEREGAVWVEWSDE
ncbi:MAG: hypothetical protein AAGF20_00020 [Pseudomonadota bacterium]